MKKYYETLGLEENCSETDVKAAFIGKLKSYSKLTKEIMLPYAQAYAVLSHPSERAKYDSVSDWEYDFSKRYPSVSNPERICDVILEELMFFEKNLHADFMCARRDIIMGLGGTIFGLFFVTLLILLSLRLRVGIYVVIFGATGVCAGVFFKGIALYFRSVNKRIKFKENMWNSVNL